MYKSIFAEPKTAIKTSGYQSIFGVQKKVEPVAEKKKTLKLSPSLGGGELNVGANGSLATTTRGYAGIDAPGQWREHIFPVALGGTSTFDNIKVYGKDLGAKKTAYENDIIKKYKEGKIDLPEAQGLVLKKFRELTGVDKSTKTSSYLWEGFKDIFKSKTPSKNLTFNVDKTNPAISKILTEGKIAQNKDFYKGVTGSMALQAGITPEQVAEETPKTRFGALVALTSLAFPERGTLGIAARTGLGENLISKGIQKLSKLKSSENITKVSEKVATAKTGYKSIFEKPEIKVEEPLLQEAKKYKSAEEFVKAQGTPVYHGTASDFEMFDPKFKGYSTDAESAKGAFWFTDDPATAKAYAIYAAEDAPVQRLLKQADEAEKLAQKTGKESDWAKYDKLVEESEKLAEYDATFARRQKNAKVKEAYVKGEFLEVDAKGKTPQELSTDDNIDSWLNSKIQQAIKENKAGLKIVNIDDAVGLYDKPSTHYAVFNADQIKTKSQLTDLWNKANNKAEPLIEEAKKYKSAEEFVFDTISGNDKYGNAYDKLSGLVKYRNISDFIPYGKVEFTEKALKGKITAGQEIGQGAVEIWKKRISSGERPIVILDDTPYEVKTTISSAANQEYTSLWIENRIRQGHHRLEAYRQLGIKKVPVVSKSQLTDIWNKANQTKAIEDITNELGFARLPQVMVRAAESIAPIEHQDEVVKTVFKDWTRKLLKGEEVANKQLTKVPQLADNFDTILKYEQGVKTKYTDIIKKEFDSLFQKAEKEGIELRYKENYVPQVYNNTMEEVKTAMSKYMKDNGVSGLDMDRYLEGIKELPDAISKRLKLNPFFSKDRAFPNYKTAMEYGLTPKYTEPGQLLAHYDAELSKTLANREFISKLLEEGKIAAVDGAGSSWQALTLPFSPKGYYAPPELAKLLNGMFRNEEMLGATQTFFKGLANVSKTMQEIVLSAGVPKTNINFFAIGQLVKNLTAGEYKAAVAFIRSNFNAPSIKFFVENGQYLEKMANQGVDVLKRVDNYATIYKKLSDTKGILGKIGVSWDKAFGEKTFKSFMPQMQVQTFKDVYNSAIKKGLSSEQAEILAGDTTKAFYGLHENLGRGKGTEDVLGATFFAPKFREGIINTLFNTAKSATVDIFNPAFSKNRKLLMGMILSYAGYNALNKKLTGHYMWENPDGKEFDLMIPTKLGNEQDDVIYIGFMPSFLAFARNMASGVVATVKGDMPTAKQKFGSVFSMPIKTASEIWANKDYFGREIYKEYDDRKTKLKKIASYAFLSVNHPFVEELYNQITTDKPLYQSVSEAMEMPLKFSSYTKIEKQEFYEAVNKQQVEEAKQKADFTPRYTEIRGLLDAGKIDEATKLTEGMNEEEYKIYKSLKRADKTRADVDQQIKVFSKYKQIKELMQAGRIDEATAITSAMNKEEYAAYRQLKTKLE